MDTARAAHDFERSVQALLESVGFGFDDVRIGAADAAFDLAGTFGGERWVIEIKYYRTERPQVSLIRAAASRLLLSLPVAGARRAMLVVSSVLGPELVGTLGEEFGIVLVDRADLFVWAGNQPELVDRFAAALEISRPPTERPDSRDVDATLAEAPAPADDKATADRTGTDLCLELKALKPGQKTAKQYEKLGVRILQYLFPDHLDGWHEQRATADGLNRFDVVCRVKPLVEFWEFVVLNLQSRYVLFEFKNYGSAIKQWQVLTTEKYLLERALRRVAFIVSRRGPDKGAVKAAQGAMREHGKLLLMLDDRQICRMLQMRERGDDPSEYMFQIADDFLLTLPR